MNNINNNNNKPVLCIITPRNYPVPGGVELYSQDVAKFVSNDFNTFIITSNLNRITRNIFDKYSYVDEKYGLIFKNVKIIRAKTLKNLFYSTLTSSST